MWNSGWNWRLDTKTLSSSIHLFVFLSFLALFSCIIRKVFFIWQWSRYWKLWDHNSETYILGEKGIFHVSSIKEKQQERLGGSIG